MRDIENYLLNTPNIKSIIEHIESTGNQLVTGISSSARNLLTSMIYRATEQPIVIWAPNLLQATQIYEDLRMIDSEIP